MANTEATYQFFINGTEVLPPVNWMDIDIEAAFDENMQAYLTIESLTFTPDHFPIIDDWTSKQGYFEGCPVQIVFTRGTTVKKIDFCLDFNSYEVISPVERRIGLLQNNSLNGLMERLEAFSFGWLSEQKDSNNNYYIVPSDFVNVPITVKKRFDGSEIAITYVSLVMLNVQIYFFISETKKQLSQTVSVLTSTPTQKPAEIIKAIAFSLLLLAYAAAMAIVMYNLIKTIFKNVAPRNVKYKGITLRKGLEIIGRYLGYTIDCDIPEIDKYVYLPSKKDNTVHKNRRDDGMPNVSDFGYQASEFVELVRMLFLAKSQIIGDKIVIRALKSPYWYQNTNYVMPDILEYESFKYNTNELIANYLIGFAYDPANEYSYPVKDEVGDFEKSNNAQTITDLIRVKNTRNKLNKGLSDKIIPVALATSRNKLSALETLLKDLLKISDLFTNLFHGQPVAEKVEVLKGRVMLSQPNTSVPMLIPIVNGYMPNDPAKHLGAKYLWDNYHWWTSFVENPTVAQRKNYNDKRIPFSFVDYVETSQNAAFTTQTGKKGKFNSIKWRPGSDEAVVSFWVGEKYTDNLKTLIVES